MSERASVRDTDADWDAIGAAMPFAGATGNVRLSGTALSDTDRAALLASGRADIAHTLAMLRRHFDVPERFAHALDFGCGVGRHLPAMQPHCGRVRGVDVSRPMRRIARAMAPGADIGAEIGAGPYDWVNSLIVFQHILPARGLDLLDRLLDACAPDAAVSLHFALRVAPDRHPDAPVGHVSHFAYPVADVLERLSRARVFTVHAEWLDLGLTQGVRLYGARGAYRGSG